MVGGMMILEEATGKEKEKEGSVDVSWLGSTHAWVIAKTLLALPLPLPRDRASPTVYLCTVGAPAPLQTWSVPISRIITTPAALTATIAVMVMDLHSLLLLLKVGRQSRRKLLSLVPSPREQLDGRGRGEVGQKEEEEREEEEEGRKNRGRT
ncbi:hypothetical protein NSK_007246 [Nannochloropsis salina CCMP1776]|uniref:Uncharacterized protein n=1 Tax=Nannochloropsis salina CCMP1776 TaxID=1027361 RepID=A0A4D9CUU9_9STRA|nr:hypothetical protein NSK_007246 [Nannochloropsis salina CCMP1776]|eukprot:TFJ81285.1 hypothetical protein NSK_007246 [Nannochloropsis salina CCMP1776]